MASLHAHAKIPPEGQQPKDFAFFLSPKEAWDAMFEDCMAAKKSIEIEQYIFMPDPLGMKFIELFMAKVKEGVAVRLILDRIGSHEFYFSNWPKELEKNGVEISFYNPISFTHLLHPSSWLPRDHTKTLIVDGKIAYTGGVCFDKRMGNWRDTHLRFDGPPAETAHREHAALWKNLQRGEFIVSKRLSPAKEGRFAYTISLPFFRRDTIYQLLRKEISAAREYVSIVTPYFIPPARFVRLLQRKARAGIRIRIIVARRSDVSFADYIAQAYFRRLFRSGIQVFFYEPTVLHAKFFIVDGRWAGIGSTNMDYLSFLKNREANVITHDREMIDELQSQFKADLKNSREYTLDDWKKRPISHRIIGYLGRPLRRFM